MLRLATCKDLIDLRGKHKSLDEALRQSTYKCLKLIHNNSDPMKEPQCEDFAWGLKQMGTLFCAEKIINLKPQTVLEAGAGLNGFFNSHFGDTLDYWMIDKSGFYSPESFTSSMAARKNTKYVDGLLGEFSTQLPGNYFDFVFSISVLEHVPFDRLKLVFEDIYRVLKPGGFSVHTIDVNPHSPAANSKDLIQMIRDAGFEFASPPGELDWNVGKIHDPVLLEPLRIVYEYYYKKSFDSPQPDPYLVCYHFGSIIVCIFKPESAANKADTPKDNLQQQIYSYFESIDEITCNCSKSTPLGAFQNLQISKYFYAIKLLLKQDTTLFFKDEKIRDFLYRTFHLNPLIPKRFGGIACDTILPMPGALGQQFIDALRSQGNAINVTEFRPDLALYRTFLEQNAQFYQSRFGNNPLHGDSYFFQKTLEHFITFYLIGQSRAVDIMDIGSAGHQYARIVRQAYPEKRVYVQDLCFPEGNKILADGFFQIGGSAASLPLDDSSIDFVTFHCSIEHFEQDADIKCLVEIERILRPGGIAVIIPLHTDDEYTIAVNPITGPFLDDDFIADSILPELQQNSDAHIVYTNGMVSRFARKYSAKTLMSRLLSTLRHVTIEFCTIEIPDAFSTEEILSEKYFGGAYKRFIPHDRRCFLKLIKKQG